MARRKTQARRIRELEAENRRLRAQLAWMQAEFGLCRLCLRRAGECRPFQPSCVPALDPEALP